MKDINALRKSEPGILVWGNHPAVVQSVLDFDFMSGKSAPSVVATVTGNRKAQKYFFGTKEILIRCYPSLSALPESVRARTNWLLNLQSGRKSYETTLAFFDAFPKAEGAHLFAENVPERHAADLIKRFGGKHRIVGPSGVGFMIPRVLKLGAVGGIDAAQISEGKLTTPGSVAVISTSGGMTNELIRAVVGAGKRLSFAMSIGGDRFPVTSLTEVFSAAEADPDTKAVVYFGELGGTDEYEIIDLIKAGKFTKPLVAYVAGIIDEAFTEHMQFGHAKALVMHKDDGARAKREALREAGVSVSDTFPEFMESLTSLPSASYTDYIPDIEPLMNRQKSILSTRRMVTDEVPSFVKGGKLVAGAPHAFAASVFRALTGAAPKSEITSAFTEAVFTLLIDHGGHVSGAVNSMITARAGKDMPAAVSAGLLTVGPRFGGAINAAADAWRTAVANNESASDFVERKNKAGELILGIGHRKYRVGIPDPRVEALSAFADLLKKHPHYDFARAVEKITTGKNGSLILNVDGLVAALLLDILTEAEGYSDAQLKELTDAEFFNAFFVIPRTAGFASHFIEQKRNDEGLFRLPDELLFERPEEA